MKVVKRKGQEQEFDEKKLYASCYHALRSAHTGKQESENICEKVIPEVKKHFKNQDVVDSQEIFEKTIEVMAKFHEDGAYLYKTLRDVN